MKTMVKLFLLTLAVHVSYVWSSEGHGTFIQLSHLQEEHMTQSTGTAAGTLTIDGNRLDLKHAYAMSQPNTFDEEKNDIAVLLTPEPLPDGALEGLEDLMDAVGRLRGWALFKIDEEGKAIVETIDHTSLGERRIMMSGLTYAKFTAKNVGKDRIEGSFATSEAEETFGHTYEIKVSFEAPIVEAKRPEPLPDAKTGKALPADGGEPGKAFLAFTKAVHANDKNTVRSMLYVGEEVPVDEEQYEMMIEMLQMSLPENPTIEKGYVKDDRAVVYVTGTREGENVWGLIETIKKDGKWLVGHTSWSDSPHEK